MKITKKTTKGLKREFDIKISSKEIEERINQKLSEIALTAKIPGFRPGKIPTSILKARIGKEVRGEVLQNSIFSICRNIPFFYIISFLNTEFKSHRHRRFEKMIRLTD